MALKTNMNQLKKNCLIIALTSALVSYSGASLADHGSLGFGIGTASPIITQPGITLPAKMWATCTIMQFSRFDQASDQKLLGLSEGPHPDVHSVKTLFTPALFAAYGLTDNLTLGIKVPFTVRTGLRSPGHHDEHEHESGGINKLGNANGFGDVSLFGQYRFFKSADNLNHASFTVGLKTPTGRTGSNTNQGPLFETHHQPGTGSWDPSVGLSYTRVMGTYSFDTNVLYTFVTEGTQKTNLGDRFNYNFALSYAFGAPARNAFFAASNNAPWTAILELNGEWAGHQQIDGISSFNSGNNALYISPGIRYSSGSNWNTALSIGTPLYQDSRGYQSDTDYRISYRLVFAFN